MEGDLRLVPVSSHRVKRGLLSSRTSSRHAAMCQDRTSRATRTTKNVTHANATKGARGRRSPIMPPPPDNRRPRLIPATPEHRRRGLPSAYRGSEKPGSERGSSLPLRRRADLLRFRIKALPCFRAEITVRPHRLYAVLAPVDIGEEPRRLRFCGC